MPILLPNLDDRRWTDLVNEGRALIPLYAPEWTDQNAHDPGITLIELMAWLAEMNVYRVNRVTDRAKLKFLSLLGIHPEPPRAASTVLSFSLLSGTALALPGKLEFAPPSHSGPPTVFEIAGPLTVQPTTLIAVQIKNGNAFTDVTERWRRRLGFGIFGDLPQIGSELYLGFASALTVGEPFHLFFQFSNRHSKPAERSRILNEARVQNRDCTPPVPQCCGSAAARPGMDMPMPDSRVRLSWELSMPGSWGQLQAVDDTMGFTLDGGVAVTPSGAGAKLTLGQVSTSLYYVRVRFAAGDYDSPPALQTLAVNAVGATQCLAAGNISWPIAPGVITPPLASQPVGLALAFDADEQISSLSFVADGDRPKFSVLGLTPASATARGEICFEAAWLGSGTGTPMQQATLPYTPVESTLNVFTLEDSVWRTWNLRPDFDSSAPRDPDFLLDPTTGIITFGDGNQGRIVPYGAKIIVALCGTKAGEGNLRRGLVHKLVDSPHNRLLLTNFKDASDRLLTENSVPAAGGSAAESLDAAIARAIRMLSRPLRAVTLADHEQLALETPGTDVARAKAWADHHPDFPCFAAPGIISVIILPNMAGPRPVPSPGLLASVSAYLNRRRIMGSRIEVRGPTYRTVTVQAQVQAAPGSSKSALPQRVVNALNHFLDPLTGGPEGSGWPFGRDVFRTEILQVIDQVAGVEYVTQLALLVDGCLCDPKCGNVCLSPNELVAAGEHKVEVLGV